MDDYLQQSVQDRYLSPILDAAPPPAASVLEELTEPRVTPCQRCVAIFANYPTARDEENGVKLCPCADDNSASEKCHRCRKMNKQCIRLPVRLINSARYLQANLESYDTPEFRRIQLFTRKALQRLKNKSGKAAEQITAEEDAQKGHFASVRQDTKLKLQIDMANSLALLAQCAFIIAEHLDPLEVASRQLKVLPRECPTTFVDAVHAEQELIDTLSDEATSALPLSK